MYERCHLIKSFTEMSATDYEKYLYVLHIKKKKKNSKFLDNDIEIYVLLCHYHLLFSQVIISCLLLQHML